MQHNYFTSGKKTLFAVFAVLLSVASFAQDCLDVSATTSNVTCYGTATGSITVSVTGGSGNYSYTWLGTGGMYNGQNRTNLIAGNYTLTVKDLSNSSCQVTKSFTITEPAPLDIVSIDKTWHNGYGLSCANSTDGELAVFMEGGTQPYLYSINDGAFQSSNVFSNLPAGTYYTTVQDANGCLVTNNPNSGLPRSVNYVNPLVQITGPDPLVADPITALPTGGAGDSIVIFAGQSLDLVAGSVTGGVAPYNYLWSPFTGMGDPTSTSINVAPTSTTTYTLTITDANGCVTTRTFKVVVNQLSGGGGGGTGGGGGGTGGSGGSGKVNVCHNGKLIAVSRSALASHVAHGDNIGFCSPYVSKAVNSKDLIDQPEISVAANVIYPNPTNGKFALRITNVTGRIEIQVVNATGMITEKRVITNNAEETVQQFNLTGKPAGVYFIKINSAALKPQVYRVVIR